MENLKIILLSLILFMLSMIYSEIKIEQEYLDDIEYYKHEDIN